MKKVTIALMLVITAMTAYAQPQIGDWAKFSRYEEANKEVSVRPKAVFMGDSITDVIDHHPKYVVILAGTNDVAKNLGVISHENTLGNIISMCELARANKIKPIICSVLPCNYFFWRPEEKGQEKEIIKLNALLKEYARSAKIPYVDYHTAMKDENDGLPKKYADDGCHPNRNGYKLMEKIILEYL